ncbi:gamma-tubulin complex component protein, partial [Kipferlia bialata]
ARNLHCILVSSNELLRTEKGRVANALAAGLLEIVAEHKHSVARLDDQARNGVLLLSQLEQQLLKPARTLDAVKTVVETVMNQYLSGGTILHTLESRLREESDPLRRNAFLLLFNRAVTPYLTMLAKWVYLGYMPPCDIPEFLEDVKEDILSAGKHRDVLRGYEDSLVRTVSTNLAAEHMTGYPTPPVLSVDVFNPTPLHDMIRQSRAASGQAVLSLLTSEQVDLYGVLRTARRFILG